MIEAENIYVGIMPIRSLINQKWIINIKPQKTSININQNFFKTDKSLIKANKLNKERFNYDLNFNLKKFAKLRLNDFNLETEVRGSLRYRS